MENVHGRAVILSPELEWIGVRARGPLEVGEFYQGPGAGFKKYALAAAVILFLTMGTLDFFTVQAYAQVADGVEVGLNRWGRVVTARALNDEGAQMIEQFRWKGKKLGDAKAELAVQIPAEGALEQDERYKQFPDQALNKGNKDADLIEKVEENKNQGLVKSIEKGKQEPAPAKKDKIENESNGGSSGYAGQKK